MVERVSAVALVLCILCEIPLTRSINILLRKSSLATSAPSYTCPTLSATRSDVLLDFYTSSRMPLDQTWPLVATQVPRNPFEFNCGMAHINFANSCKFCAFMMEWNSPATAGRVLFFREVPVSVELFFLDKNLEVTSTGTAVALQQSPIPIPSGDTVYVVMATVGTKDALNIQVGDPAQIVSGSTNTDPYVGIDEGLLDDGVAMHNTPQQ